MAPVRIAVGFGLLLSLGAAGAEPPRFSDRADGISCGYFDVAAGASWPANRPRWYDAAGVPDGPKAFATVEHAASEPRRVWRIDLLPLARAWWAGSLAEDGVLLRIRDGAWTVFHARESADPVMRPQLRLRWSGGTQHYVEAVADAALDCSTYRGLGTATSLAAKGGTYVALRFDARARARIVEPPVEAELVLVRTPESRPELFRADVFAIRSPLGIYGPARREGIARAFPGDRGVGGHADVFFADGFDTGAVDARWTRGMATASSVVRQDPSRGFVPLSGPALRVRIPKGQQLGLDLRYRFKDRHGAEPDEVYLRYYLRLAPDWLSASDGGKLPGLAGTYGKGGWGGRPWDGRQGWSARGSFGTALPAGHVAEGRLMLGSYVYHARAASRYGEGLAWAGSGLGGAIEPDRWYCIEQRVRMNTPGVEDGVLEVWVDGRLVFARHDLRLRDREELHVEEAWMNVFHGGTAAAPADMHAYIDQVVIARHYIGPLAP